MNIRSSYYLLSLCVLSTLSPLYSMKRPTLKLTPHPKYHSPHNLHKTIHKKNPDQLQNIQQLSCSTEPTQLEAPAHTPSLNLAFWQAVACNNTLKACGLLGHDTVNPNYTPAQCKKMTPLALACMNGNKQLVNALLRYNIIDIITGSPFLLAAKLSSPEIVIALVLKAHELSHTKTLAYNKKIFAHKKEAFFKAVHAGCEHTARVLLNDPLLATPDICAQALIHAAKKTDHAMVRVIIDAVPIELTNNSTYHAAYYTARTHAIEQNSTLTLAHLLYNIDHEDKKGETSLSYAIRGGNPLIVDLILDNAQTLTYGKHAQPVEILTDNTSILRQLETRRHNNHLLELIADIRSLTGKKIRNDTDSSTDSARSNMHSHPHSEMDEKSDAASDSTNPDFYQQRFIKTYRSELSLTDDDSITNSTPSESPTHNSDDALSPSELSRIPSSRSWSFKTPTERQKK